MTGFLFYYELLFILISVFEQIWFNGGVWNLLDYLFELLVDSFYNTNLMMQHLLWMNQLGIIKINAVTI